MGEISILLLKAQTYAYTYVGMYIHAYIRMYMYTYIHMYIYACINMYAHCILYMHSYYICTYIRIHAFSPYFIFTEIVDDITIRSEVLLDYSL